LAQELGLDSLRLSRGESQRSVLRDVMRVVRLDVPRTTEEQYALLAPAFQGLSA
jgi:hypothetical protein